ncbi:zinc-binding dehydrogenase [Leadbettera azotonutricia]|uniref:L-sorbose 1-phosphate reductase n=1 Tax=Leadbettera azotonutricia (strain ATCC BAA-888 / DSM 13862 / ZAS-9) TaxID=545695 RepID=F5Y7T4_LEAAZ|nr:zinc-binding dehydrogenase [Leadbettera azotonutricia]AEF82660.1 L-sorbose 1-phosphate reductase [Leadbettera azotonutricia ZAS-9]
MKTKAIRIYGQNDLRLEEFELPQIKDDEILAKIISDSICMSSHKLAMQGNNHKRVKEDLAKRPIIIGHEFCGELVEVGAKWKNKFKAGDKFAIQPALNAPGPDGKATLWAPGYSYQFIGGDATYIIIPKEVMELGCLLEYKAQSFYLGSLAEPISCIVGTYHAQYHTRNGSYVHDMGIVEGGSIALLASAGPMGLGAIDYAVHCPRKPKLLVVTDIDDARLQRAASIFSPAEAAKFGVRLEYVNTKEMADPVASLKELNGGKLYNDVLVFAPVKPVVEMGDKLLGSDGCLNFFAGPTDPTFSATFNFYNVHYESHHLVGTSGGNTDDLKESIAMMAAKQLNPSSLITHVGGLNAVAETTINLDKIPGGKKLIYTHKNLPLTAIADFAEKGKTDPFWKTLADIAAKNNGLWSGEAEEYLLKNAPEI